MELYFEAKRHKEDYYPNIKKCVDYYTEDLKESFLKNLLGIEVKETLTEAIKTFKAYQKLEILLHGEQFDS
jgi:hypothetical protein